VVFDRLIGLLQSNKTEFTTKEHVAVSTSQEAANVRGSRLSQGAKAMLVRTKGEFSLVVVSAAKKLDMKALKTELNTKSLSFATVDEVHRLTGCVPGGVPPFGSLFQLPTLMDVSLRSEDEIEFNAGMRTRSVHMRRVDYEAIEKPRVVSVSSAADDEIKEQQQQQ